MLTPEAFARELGSQALGQSLKGSVMRCQHRLKPLLLLEVLRSPSICTAAFSL